MNRVRRCGGLALLASVVLLLLGAARSEAQEGTDMTGTWYNKESVFSVRQVGPDVWWVCRSAADNGKSWTSVFTGKLTGSTLTGTFADVPSGKNRAYGVLKADVKVKAGKVTAIEGEIIFLPGNGRDNVRMTRTKPK